MAGWGEGRAATADDDAELMRLVVERDVRAFERLYRRHHARLVGLVVRLTRRPDLAEDIGNEAMLVAWQKADSFRGAARVSTWLCGIAYRLALKRLGQQQRHDGALDIDEVDVADPVSIEGQAQDAQIARLLQTAVAALPAAQRAVVELTFYHGCSQAEIAEMLDCPEGTVKSRMFHARQRLRLALRKQARELEEEWR